MCGIAGFSLSPNVHINSKRLAKSLLLAIEYRGLDATGFAYLDSTGAFQVHKKDVAASDFVKRRLCLPKRSRTAIFHTRFATQGDPFWNENNHPIATGTVVGVHNGHINNDDSIFRSIETLMGVKDIRVGTVDSEAAFAALGWTNEPVCEILESLQGAASLAWLDMQSENPETLHLARVSSSPLIVGETMDGSVVFASTEDAVITACAEVGLDIIKLREIPEGEYFEVLYGFIDNVKHFDVPVSKWANYRYKAARNTAMGFEADLDDYAWDGKQWDARTAGSTPPQGKLVVVNTMGSTLDARLAAEEPEVGDNDDMRYEDWLRENNAELDRLEQKDALKDDARFASFCEQRWLHAGYLTDPMLPVPKYESTAMYLADDLNVQREAAIETWGAGLSCQTELARTTACETLKAGVRAGDPVTIELNGCRCEGNIMHTPQSFPGGWYIIRAFVFNEKRPRNHETVFVARQHYEFQVAGAYPLTPRQKELTK